MTTAENLMADEAIKSSIPSEHYVRSAFHGISLGKVKQFCLVKALLKISNMVNMLD